MNNGEGGVRLRGMNPWERDHCLPGGSDDSLLSINTKWWSHIQQLSDWWAHFDWRVERWMCLCAWKKRKMCVCACQVLTGGSSGNGGGGGVHECVRMCVYMSLSTGGHTAPLGHGAPPPHQSYRCRPLSWPRFLTRDPCHNPSGQPPQHPRRWQGPQHEQAGSPQVPRKQKR